MLVLTNVGVAAREDEGTTNMPLLPPLLLDTGVAPYGIQKAVPPEAPELLLLDELMPPDEELLLLLLLEEELLEDDELLDEPELLELEDEGALELLPDDPPPHPARTAASSRLPRSAVFDSLEHAQLLAASALPCSESRMTGVDMILAPLKVLCRCLKRRSLPVIRVRPGLGASALAAIGVLSPSQGRRNSAFLGEMRKARPKCLIGEKKSYHPLPCPTVPVRSATFCSIGYRAMKGPCAR